jgi:hypothetical protein
MDDEPDPGRDQPLHSADVQPPASGASIRAGEEAAGCDEDHAFLVPPMCDSLTWQASVGSPRPTSLQRARFRRH